MGKETEKICRINDVMFMTKDKASKVINSIIAMKKNYVKKSASALK